MSKTKNEIIGTILALILKNGEGGSSHNWYVGISENARKGLFVDHNVNEISDLWIIELASTSGEAREIEDYFLNTFITDGGPGGGGPSARMVYAYKKTPHTKP